MQSSTAIAVITATLVAIGAALGVSTSGGWPDRIDNFHQIAFIRQIEHGQIALLGRCPLEREIIIEPTGNVQINWHVQNILIFHGCGRATDSALDRVSDTQREDSIIARLEITLTQIEMNLLIKKLEGLSWQIEYLPIEETMPSHSIGCSYDYIDHSYPARTLWVDKSDAEVAALAADERYVPQTPSCIAKEEENAAVLDGAFASFAPLLPDKYELRPEVAGRLDREE